MIKTVGYASTFFQRSMKPKQFEREEPGAKDVELELLYCGICHSDLHQIKNDWMNTIWPCVPGHEIVGRVSRIGSEVKNFEVGDIAAVGCMIDSCGKCYSCEHGEEQYCESSTGALMTYNGPMNPTFQNTYGGYSSSFVIAERFLLPVPEGMPIQVVGPILCAGVTTYSPLKRWGVKAGMKVGIVGLGGLGHMATQFARALGAEVTVVTTSPDKRADAVAFGATNVVLSTDKKQMKNAGQSLDLILNTIPYQHKIEPYLDLLHRDGAMVIVGVLAKQPGWNPQKVLMQRKTIAGSLIGSLAETREVLEFCARNKIYPSVEVIEAHEINEAHKNVKAKKARYRYVIDLASLRNEDRAKLGKIHSVSHRLQEDRKVVMPPPPVHAGENRQNVQPEWSSSANSRILL